MSAGEIPFIRHHFENSAKYAILLIFGLHYFSQKSKISPKANIKHEVDVLMVGLEHINSNKSTLEYPESAVINVVLVEF